MRLSWAALSHPGLRRTVNEDTWAARPDLGLFVVADGMGGHAAGEVASRLATDAIERFVAQTASADRHQTWPFPYEPSVSLNANRLKAAFRLANRGIAANAPGAGQHHRPRAAGRCGITSGSWSATAR
jgi:PPM family protein phosphatase